MDYRQIPGTELSVSRVCLGTMTFGDQMDETAVKSALSYAVEHGVNFVDTADIYPRPHPTATESILGNTMKPWRQQLIVASKAGGMTGPGPDDRGLGRKHLIQAVEDSLTRLQTDYLDLYYAHFPDKAVTPEELISTMNELIKAGKIRYYGISNFSAWQVCEMVLKAHEMGLQPPVASENVYNLLTRGIESELLPLIRKYPMGLMTYNPLAGGLLSGKYQSGEKISNTRFSLEKGYADRYWSEQNLQAVTRIQELAQQRGQTVLALALQWLYSQPEVTSIILGFSRLSQLEQNLTTLEMIPEDPLPEAELLEVWKVLTGNRFPYHS